MRLYREYGIIDDVDIDLHINIGFLDVSQLSFLFLLTPPHHYIQHSQVDILQSNTSFIMHSVLITYLRGEEWPQLG